MKIYYKTFLSVDDFATLSNSVIKYDAVQLICNRIRDSVIISGLGLYTLNKNNAYDARIFTESLIVGIISEYISLSSKKLSDTDKGILQNCKGFVKLFSNSYINSEKATFKYLLSGDDIVY